MKPLKKWEPIYRFGGNPTDYCVQPPLGTTVRATKPKKTKRKK